MNYTTEQVIDLYNQYNKYRKDEFVLSIDEKRTLNCKEFINWLKDKEQSELPVKDQLIWVRDRDELDYQPRYFAKFIDNIIFCYPDGFKSSNMDEDNFNLVPWDEYSLTDPNK